MSRLLSGLLSVVGMMAPSLGGEPPVILEKVVAAMRQAYGKDFGGTATRADGSVVFQLGGTEVLYDDGRAKSLEEKLDHADIEDMFSQVYPLGDPAAAVAPGVDPGRVRADGLFQALYGATAKEVERSCVPVDFCGHKVRFNARCGAAEALQAVGRDLEALIEKRPEWKVFVQQLGGTFHWRPIAGTDRLSTHSFGIAIDLNTDRSQYWQWDPPEKRETVSRKTWPAEIVRAFERHGFIWGGRWYHYDTMHFEFRPEILAYSKLVAGERPSVGPD